MRRFIPIWFGQLVSLVGSGLTGFALGVWVYQETGMVTYFSIISLFTSLPSILFSPFAGAFIDRWNKRRAMMMSDLGAGLCTLTIVILLISDHLELWHIYLLMGISSTFGAFQWPAFIAMSSETVEKKHIGRVGGMMQLAQSFAYIIAPMLGGTLYSVIALEGVIAIDFASCLFAISILFLLKTEKQEVPARSEHRLIIKDISEGVHYIFQRKGLASLLVFFFILNFISASISVLSMPFILSMVSTKALGYVLSIGAIGMLIGSAAMSIWGGPKEKMKWINVFSFICSICVILAGFTRTITFFTVISFIFFLSAPVISSANQTIWQVKVEIDKQGRVFAIRRMLAAISMPIAYIVIGPLADNVFEPMFSETRQVSEFIVKLIGLGAGKGIAFMFVLLGIFFLIAVIIGCFYKPIQEIEKRLPDAMQ
jgi:MFS family permease